MDRSHIKLSMFKSFVSVLVIVFLYTGTQSIYAQDPVPLQEQLLI